MSSLDKKLEQTSWALFVFIGFLVVVLMGGVFLGVSAYNLQARELNDVKCFNTSVANLARINARDRELSQALVIAEGNAIRNPSKETGALIRTALDTYIKESAKDDAIRKVNPLKFTC